MMAGTHIGGNNGNMNESESVEAGNSSSRGKGTGKQVLSERQVEVDSQIYRFREEAFALEEEKDSLSDRIYALKANIETSIPDEFDKEIALSHLERISSRLLTVDISITPERSEAQEEKLYNMNKYIDEMIVDLKKDPFSVRERCISYISACYSNNDSFDEEFREIYKGCARCDENHIIKRLQGFLNYIDTNYSVVLQTEN